MGKSTKGELKDIAPPSTLPDLPPYIPPNFPFVQRQSEQMDEDEPAAEVEEESRRKKRQSGTDTSSAAKPTYCDGVDEIGCYQVRNNLNKATTGVIYF